MKLLHTYILIIISLAMAWGFSLEASENKTGCLTIGNVIIKNSDSISVSGLATTLSKYTFNQNGTNLDNLFEAKHNKPYLSVEAEKIVADSIAKVYLRNDNELVIDIRHGSQESYITISIYNMLAKPVLEVYKGNPGSVKNQTIQYNKSAALLPNGHYFCILEGNNNRVLKKFIISR